MVPTFLCLLLDLIFPPGSTTLVRSGLCSRASLVAPFLVPVLAASNNTSENMEVDGDPSTSSSSPTPSSTSSQSQSQSQSQSPTSELQKRNGGTGGSRIQWPPSPLDDTNTSCGSVSVKKGPHPEGAAQDDDGVDSSSSTSSSSAYSGDAKEKSEDKAGREEGSYPAGDKSSTSSSDGDEHDPKKKKKKKKRTREGLRKGKWTVRTRLAASIQTCLLQGHARVKTIIVFASESAGTSHASFQCASHSA